MQRRFIFIVISVLNSVTLQAQDILVPAHEETINFIEQSISDLKKMDPAGEIPVDLREHYNWFQTDMANCEHQKYFESFLQDITDNYKKIGKFAKVKLMTDREGAIIKFQTIFEKLKMVPPRQADNPTNKCEVQLAPGQYFIWSERSGKATSDIKRRVYIHLDTPTVTITEN